MQSQIKIMALCFSTNLMMFSAGYAQENSTPSVWEDTELQPELRFLRLELFLHLKVNVAGTRAETSLQSRIQPKTSLWFY